MLRIISRQAYCTSETTRVELYDWCEQYEREDQKRTSSKWILLPSTMIVGLRAFKHKILPPDTVVFAGKIGLLWGSSRALLSSYNMRLLEEKIFAKENDKHFEMVEYLRGDRYPYSQLSERIEARTQLQKLIKYLDWKESNRIELYDWCVQYEREDQKRSSSKWILLPSIMIVGVRAFKHKTLPSDPVVFAGKMGLLWGSWRALSSSYNMRLLEEKIFTKENDEHFVAIQFLRADRYPNTQLSERIMARTEVQKLIKD